MTKAHEGIIMLRKAVSKIYKNIDDDELSCFLMNMVINFGLFTGDCMEKDASERNRDEVADLFRMGLEASFNDKDNQIKVHVEM